MRLIVTGGGTGGHVFPALEVARLAISEGHDVLYLGSNRGQESRVCERAKIAFHGFPSEPIYSLKKPSGWLAVVQLVRARSMAIKRLKLARPDALFSTGGYSSAPVVSAAKVLRIPYVIHEQNSVPGRTNLAFSKAAFRVCTTFDCSATHFSTATVRTGMPVRSACFRKPSAGRPCWWIT